MPLSCRKTLLETNCFEMSAAQFVQLLDSELGWRPAKDRKKLQATDFEWMFISDDSNKAFLSWMCNHLTKRNVLSHEELRQYESPFSSFPATSLPRHAVPICATQSVFSKVAIFSSYWHCFYLEIIKLKPSGRSSLNFEFKIRFSFSMRCK